MLGIIEIDGDWLWDVSFRGQGEGRLITGHANSFLAALAAVADAIAQAVRTQPENEAGDVDRGRGDGTVASPRLPGPI